MTLLAQMTFVHMESSLAIDRLDRGLARLSRRADDPVEGAREIDAMVSTALRMRRKLTTFFEREQRELFPLARRILGDDGRELQRLSRARTQLMKALEEMVVALSEGAEADGLELHRLRQLFQALVECHDEHCEAERDFYQVHATILFPGGVASD